MSRHSIASDLVKQHAHTLKMPGLARSFERIARQGRDAGWSLEDYLVEVLDAEVTSRAESAVRNRIHAARFPELKMLDRFDFDADQGVDRSVVRELASGQWLDRADNLLLVGPIGTGKTHLAIALGIEAAKQRRHVRFERAADLVRMLLEARDERSLGRLTRRLARAQLLIVDELGFVPFDRTGAELLFNLLAERYERRSVLVTSNLAFGEWTKVLAGDEKLTTALLDRLAHHATVINTKGRSFRMKQRRKGAAKQATEAGSTTQPARAKVAAKKKTKKR